MATNIANIPPNAVEILFVEDLVQWMLHRQAGITYVPEIAEPYRNFIFNVCNDDVRKAANFIEMSLEDEIEENFYELEQVNENSFTDYALYYEEMYFEKGFLAEIFLEYCVRLVAMAVKFVLFNVREALSITLRTTLKLFENHGMFPGGWDALIVVARKYAKIYEDFQNVITPEISDDESMAQESEDESMAQDSEDESLADNSADRMDINKGNQACDHVSNRDQLQKPEREFKSEDLSIVKGGLQSEIVKSNKL